MPVYPRAFIPPTLGIRRINTHRNAVELIAEIRDIGNIDRERRIAAEVAVQQMTIDVHGAVRGHAVKPDRQVLSAIGFFETKMPAIPSDPAREKSRIDVIVRIEFALD